MFGLEPSDYRIVRLDGKVLATAPTACTLSEALAIVRQAEVPFAILDKLGGVISECELMELCDMERAAK